MFGKLKPHFLKILVVLGLLTGAYYIGSLSAKVKFYQDTLSKQAGSRTAGQPTNPNAPNVPSAPIGNPDVANITEADHILGNSEAKYALVEYSDFDCTFCSTFHTTGQQFLEEVGSEAMWVYRHFPLSALHPNAETKAIASECVAVQGGDEAFWDYADILFAEQSQQFTGADDLSSYLADKAAQVGVNASTFSNCLNNRQAIDRVNADIKSAQTAGVQGTPGNFLLNLETGDAVALQGAVPLDTVVNALEIIKL